jgi:hypothetical protein
MKIDERFWRRWLTAASIVVILFGLSMVLAPGPLKKFFAILLYSSPGALDAFTAPAVSYIALAHAVLGSVMFGWGIALLLILFGPFRRGAREGWRMLAISLAAWFVPDTAFSLWSGFWRNAVLNAALAVLFAVPLAATYRVFRGRK